MTLFLNLIMACQWPLFAPRPEPDSLETEIKPPEIYVFLDSSDRSKIVERSLKPWSLSPQYLEIYGHTKENSHFFLDYLNGIQVRLKKDIIIIHEYDVEACKKYKVRLGTPCPSFKFMKYDVWTEFPDRCFGEFYWPLLYLEAMQKGFDIDDFYDKWRKDAQEVSHAWARGVNKKIELIIDNLSGVEEQLNLSTINQVYLKYHMYYNYEESFNGDESYVNTYLLDYPPYYRFVDYRIDRLKEDKLWPEGIKEPDLPPEPYYEMPWGEKLWSRKTHERLAEEKRLKEKLKPVPEREDK